MATTRGKGDGGADAGAAAKTAARRTRTRAPEDDISGVAAPETAAPAAKRARKAAPGTGVAESPPAEAPRPRGRTAPGGGVAAGTPARAAAKTADAPKKRGGKRETYVETAARRKREKEVDQLAVDLRSFAVARPGGWNHEDWVSFLDYLATQGHDVSDAEGIGQRLERERLGVVLGGVQGLGPKRVQSLVEQFGTLWSVRHAGADDVAAVPGMTRPLAERVVEDLRTRFP